MKSKLTLLHFDGVADLLHGIDALQYYQIPICEVYTPVTIPGIESILRIKQIRSGYAVLKFGCLGGTAITTLIYYMFGQNSLNISSRNSVMTLLFTALVMLITYFFAARLFRGSAPKAISLKKSDHRYLIIVNANQITHDDDIQNLFKYATAVEISAAVKNIVIS
jgi:hypothetical protein